MLVLLLAITASADIPPPPGYVESCTVDKHTTATQECKSCEGYHGGREPCEALEADGWEKQCQTRGASVWSEVMCKAKAPSDTLEPAPPTEDAPIKDAPTEDAPSADAPTDAKSSRCDVASPMSLPALLTVLPLVATRRRRG